MQLASDPESTHSLKYEKLLGFLLSLFTISPLYRTLPFNYVSQKKDTNVQGWCFFFFVFNNVFFFLFNSLKDYLSF